MDKWIRRLKSVEIFQPENDTRTIRYTNSVGDTIEIYKKQISMSIDGIVKNFSLQDVISVYMNEMFKAIGERPYIIIKTKEQEIEFLVDTKTGHYDDLPPVYDYIRRIVIVG